MVLVAGWLLTPAACGPDRRRRVAEGADWMGAGVSWGRLGRGDGAPTVVLASRMG